MDAIREAGPTGAEAAAAELKAAITQLFEVQTPTSGDLGPQPMWDVRLNTGKATHHIKGNIATDLGLPAWTFLTWTTAATPSKFLYVVEAIRDGVERRFPGLFDSTVRTVLRD